MVQARSRGLIFFRPISWSKNLCRGVLSSFSLVGDFFDILVSRYELIPATTVSLRREAYRLRAVVFGAELKYEDETLSHEQDVHDSYADQLLLWDHRFQRAIGCTRLVYACHQGVLRVLPMEKTCGFHLDLQADAPLKRAPSQCAEVSRFLILKEYRGGVGDKKMSCSAFMTLLMGIQVYAEYKKVPYLHAIVEKRLQQAMQRVGIPIYNLGDAVEHRGWRYPIYMNTEAIRAKMNVFQSFFYCVAKWRLRRRLRPLI